MTSSSSEGPVPALELTGLTLAYGALRAVDDVTLAVRAGSRHALIGPNGAGKSSLFSVVAGARRATAGSVLLAGKDVTHDSQLKRARQGLVRTFQHSSFFPELSVLDNVAMAVESKRGRPLKPWGSTRRGGVVDEAMTHVAVAGLHARTSAAAVSLSHGERRQLEIAIVLATSPRVIMFDEPTAGMSAAETGTFVHTVRQLPSSITTIIVEHDLDVVFSLCDRVSVLAAGQLIAEGSPDEVRANAAVQVAYLGTDRSERLFEEA